MIPFSYVKLVTHHKAIVGEDLRDSRRGLSASCSGAAGEAGREVGDTIGAAHRADRGGEAVAVTDALSFWFLAHSQRPEQRHRKT